LIYDSGRPSYLHSEGVAAIAEMIMAGNNSTEWVFVYVLGNVMREKTVDTMKRRSKRIYDDLEVSLGKTYEFEKKHKMKTKLRASQDMTIAKMMIAGHDEHFRTFKTSTGLHVYSTPFPVISRRSTKSMRMRRLP
jgi:hypothetical protein